MTTPPTLSLAPPTTPSRYADPRTAAARPAPTRHRARIRTPAAAPHDPHGSTAAATATATAPPRNPVTDPADQLDTTADPNVPTRNIDGNPCTNRPGIAHLLGWPTDPAIRNVYAGRDPDFPQPHSKIGREYWYPIDRVDAYVALLAERAAAKKPPAVKDGDPDDLLHGEEAADALHIAYATLRSYTRHSLPYWTDEKTGRPLLPPPDVEEQRENRLGTYTYRAWYRHTLAEHQQHRPGPGG